MSARCLVGATAELPRNQSSRHSPRMKFPTGRGRKYDRRLRSRPTQNKRAPRTIRLLYRCAKKNDPMPARFNFIVLDVDSNQRGSEMCYHIFCMPARCVARPRHQNPEVGGQEICTYNEQVAQHETSRKGDASQWVREAKTKQEQYPRSGLCSSAVNACGARVRAAGKGPPETPSCRKPSCSKRH